jgi:hypothetical protein
LTPLLAKVILDAGGPISMRIILERSGGFAAVPALSRTIVVDTAELSPELASEIERLAAAARIGNRSNSASRSAGAADLRTYRLTIDGERRANVLEFSDPIEDAALDALVRRLEEVARQQ